jgi:hypothetical protein
VVFLDEASLPREETMALKVIHYPLDHPYVSSVILSNKLLDAAKTNRALQVLQSAPSSSDYQALAKGCIFGDSKDISFKNLAIIDALCDSFKQCSKYTIAGKNIQENNNNNSETSKSMFHLRDFVYFLRYLHKYSHIGAGAGNFELTPQALLRGLQRNFNGIPANDFHDLVHLFFNNINEALEKVHYGKWDIPQSLYTTTSIELIKESLTDNLGNTFLCCESDQN